MHTEEKHCGEGTRPETEAEAEVEKNCAFFESWNLRLRRGRA